MTANKKCLKVGCENLRARGQLFCDEHIEGPGRTPRSSNQRKEEPE